MYLPKKLYMIYKFTASKSEDKIHILKFNYSMFILIW